MESAAYPKVQPARNTWSSHAKHHRLILQTLERSPFPLATTVTLAISFISLMKLTCLQPSLHKITIHSVMTLFPVTTTPPATLQPYEIKSSAPLHMAIFIPGLSGRQRTL